MKTLLLTREAEWDLGHSSITLLVPLKPIKSVLAKYLADIGST